MIFRTDLNIKYDSGEESILGPRSSSSFSRLTAADLMHKGDQLPRLGLRASFEDVVSEMAFWGGEGGVEGLEGQAVEVKAVGCDGGDFVLGAEEECCEAEDGEGEEGVIGSG